MYIYILTLPTSADQNAIYQSQPIEKLKLHIYLPHSPLLPFRILFFNWIPLYIYLSTHPPLALPSCSPISPFLLAPSLPTPIPRHIHPIPFTLPFFYTTNPPPDPIPTSSDLQTWVCLANHSASLRSGKFKLKNQKLKPNVPPFQRLRPPKHPRLPQFLPLPARLTLIPQSRERIWTDMAAISDREPSAGLPATRPFTCSWPKGCPKVSEFWAYASFFPPLRKTPIDRKLIAPTSEFQSQIGPTETLQDTYEWKTIPLRSFGLCQEFYTTKRIDRTYSHTYRREAA